MNTAQEMVRMMECFFQTKQEVLVLKQRVQELEQRTRQAERKYHLCKEKLDIQRDFAFNSWSKNATIIEKLQERLDALESGVQPTAYSGADADERTPVTRHDTRQRSEGGKVNNPDNSGTPGNGYARVGSDDSVHTLLDKSELSRDESAHKGELSGNDSVHTLLELSGDDSAHTLLDKGELSGDDSAHTDKSELSGDRERQSTQIMIEWLGALLSSKTAHVLWTPANFWPLQEPFAMRLPDGRLLINPLFFRVGQRDLMGDFLTFCNTKDISYTNHTDQKTRRHLSKYLLLTQNEPTTEANLCMVVMVPNALTSLVRVVISDGPPTHRPTHIDFPASASFSELRTSAMDVAMDSILREWNDSDAIHSRECMQGFWDLVKIIEQVRVSVFTF